MKSFSHHAEIRLHHTDAAGVLFFGHQFSLVHDGYESFMASVGCSLRWVIEEGPSHLLIVHAEADYRQPLRVGDAVALTLCVAATSEHSFTMQYRLRRPDGQLVGSARTVHVAVDKKTGRKAPLWNELRRALSDYRCSAE